MRTLKLGMQGDDVRFWQGFLRGWQVTPEGDSADDFVIIESGTFDDTTKIATSAYQKANGLDSDGIVGRKTIGSAVADGFDLYSVPEDKASKDWPPRPLGVDPLSGNAERAEIFGKFTYKAAPTKGNPEHIDVDPEWKKANLISVEIPQIKGLPGSAGKATLHKLSARQFVAWFGAIEQKGLKDRLLTWGGSYVARFVRGSTTSLSNHSFGTAIDCNVTWNARCTIPALVGEKGCVRELAALASQFGIFWGGWYAGNLKSGKVALDGMHFEVFKVLTDDELLATLLDAGLAQPEAMKILKIGR